jgi:transposase
LAVRRWRHVPLWNIPVELVYRPARVSCPGCGVRVERIPWSSGKSSLSEPLIVVLAIWSRRLAWDVVAQLFGVSWSTVASAVKRAVEYGLGHRDLGTVLHLGVDEISRCKGHVYHTQVYDLDGKRLLYSGEGREAASLRRFFEEMGPAWCSQIRAVCCDMWAPYVDVVREMCPNGVLVFDKFHLVRHLLDAVDQVRRRETHELGRSEDNVLRGSRYIWLKNPHHLTPRQEQRLSFLERLNLKTNRAYLLKELFSMLWECRSKADAAKFLRWWFWKATHSRLKPFRKLAWMIRRHEEGILAWYNARIDNGATEAMNNNAKAVAHRSRGFRTPHVFTRALMHCLGKLLLPQTVHRFA